VAWQVFVVSTLFRVAISAAEAETAKRAEVSGIVALLLERNPELTPADIRRILTASAKRLAPGERDDNFGSGLIDPLQALQLADPRIATTTPPRQR
jgi:subtilisin family serine protease